MRRIPIRAFTLALAIAGIPGPLAAHAESEPTRPRPFAELAASPLFGIDKPMKGSCLSLLIGLGYYPFEAGLRVGGGYDAALAAGSTRFELVLGLGSGLRAIIGGLLLFHEPALPGSGGGDTRLIARMADWPNRFGIAAAIAEAPWRPFGAALGIETEIVYTAYRVDAKTALTGAAAFAAGVEAGVALRLRWGRP